MNTTKYIEFRKERELGTIVSDAFIFLRRNFKPLFKVLLRTCSIPFIFLILALAFYTNATAGANLVESITNEGDISSVLISAIALMIAGLVYNTMLYGSVSVYVKQYLAQNNSLNTQDIVQSILQQTGKFLALGFLNFALILAAAVLPLAMAGYLFFNDLEVVGFILIIVTFIALTYIYIKLSVIFPAFVNKKLSLVETIKESWHLIKNQWWMTFITVIILGILIGVVGFAFQIPSLIYMLVKTITAAQSGSAADQASMFDGVFITLQTVASSFNYILYVILAIAANFIYFNLNERKYQSGSLDQIDSIGSKNV